MLKNQIYKIIQNLEKILDCESITGYRIVLNTKSKNYMIEKPEK